PLEQLNHLGVVTESLMGISQNDTGEDLNADILKGSRNSEGAVAVLDGSLIVVHVLATHGHEARDPAHTTLVSEALGQGFGLAKAFRLPDPARPAHPARGVVRDGHPPPAPWTRCRVGVERAQRVPARTRRRPPGRPIVTSPSSPLDGDR